MNKYLLANIVDMLINFGNGEIIYRKQDSFDTYTAFAKDRQSKVTFLINDSSCIASFRPDRNITCRVGDSQNTLEKFVKLCREEFEKIC